MKIIQSVILVISFILYLNCLNAQEHSNNQSQDINKLKVKDNIYYSGSHVYTGFFTTHYRNGNIKVHGNIKEGKIEGEVTEYDKKGFTNSISLYENGELIHQTLYYAKSNVVKRKMSILNSQEDGLCMNYYPNGHLQDSGYYANGKRIGTWSYWKENGEKSHEIIIHSDSWERTDYYYEADSSYSKTVVFDKYGRRINKR